MNHDLSAVDERMQLVGDGRKHRFVGKELLGQAMHTQCIGVAGALRIDVVVQSAPGQPSVDEFDAADFDHAVALQRVQTRGFGVEEDDSHASIFPRLPHHHHSTAPSTIIGSDSHCPMLMPKARMPRKRSGSRKYSATKRSTP